MVKEKSMVALLGTVPTKASWSYVPFCHEQEALVVVKPNMYERCMKEDRSTK